MPEIRQADARQLASLVEPSSVDLVFTSPPYWRCRDYNHPAQIGQEPTPEEYVDTLVATLNSWKSLLRPHASVIINIADVFRDGSLVGIPALLEIRARQQGWLVVNRAIWAKDRGRPEPLPYRLASRYEFLFQFALDKRFYFDLHALKGHLDQASNPGDVWSIDPVTSAVNHLAPFPDELARRAILVACPERVCPNCGQPHIRLLESTMDLNPERPQALRALEIYENSHLTEEHIAAVRAVGISDAGKGQQVQNGASQNAKRTKELAREAKEVLGGYFREFTFAPKRQAGWQTCECDVQAVPGTVLDPFAGSGTVLWVAAELGRNAFGFDLLPPQHSENR